MVATLTCFFKHDGTDLRKVRLQHSVLAAPLSTNASANVGRRQLIRVTRMAELVELTASRSAKPLDLRMRSHGKAAGDNRIGQCPAAAQRQFDRFLHWFLADGGGSKRSGCNNSIKETNLFLWLFVLELVLFE
jgi:hypothetical protein